VHVAATGEVEVVAFELGVEVPPVEVPAGEVPAGEDTGLCVAEHPAMAITAPVIAATTVPRGRDRLIMDGCPL
jgi:hypothetical protein